MIIDPRIPLLSQAEAAIATDLSVKAIDNYVQHNFIVPTRSERRRLFSIRQAVRLSLVEQMSTAWQIPPKTGFLAAERLVAMPICKALLSEVIDVPMDPGWVTSTQGEERVRLRRNAEGDLEIAPLDGEPRFVDLVIAPHGFVRSVLWCCAMVLAAGPIGPDLPHEDE